MLFCRFFFLLFGGGFFNPGSFAFFIYTPLRGGAGLNNPAPQLGNIQALPFTI